jgi:DNA-directed RNA polymerase subunit RPC12/RpoP
MPDLRFHCAICGMALTGRSEDAGGVLECPFCQRIVPVPALLSGDAASGCLAAWPPGILSVEIKFHCNVCQSRIRVDARWEESLIQCPHCGAETLVPRWSRPSPTITAPLRAEEIEFLSATAAPAEALSAS